MKIRNKVIGLLLIPFVILLFGFQKEKVSNVSKAEEMYANLWNKYRVHKFQLFSEYYPNSYRPNLTYFQDAAKKTKEVSFLWPMSGVFSATNVLVELNPAKYLSYQDSMVAAVECYYDSVRKPAGYQAYPVRFEVVDRYYDDNGLVGIDYVDAYQTTKNHKYLEKAEEVMRFIMSGWSDDFGGGVTWLEGVRNQKPACSNGKATVLAVKLYQASGKEEYLNYGIKFYNWVMNNLKDDSLHIIWNSLLISGKNKKVEKRAYTYNTGTMIQSAVRLYKITGTQKYLDDARTLAEGSYSYYVKYTDHQTPYIQDLPWFVTVLFRGYHELYELDNNPKYVNAIMASASWAWEHARDPERLIFNDWTGRKKEDTKPKWLLDEACMAEVYARMALIEARKQSKVN